MMRLTEIDDEEEEDILAEIIDDDDQRISRKISTLPKKMSSMHEVAYLHHERVQESMALQRTPSKKDLNGISNLRNIHAVSKRS